MPILVIVLQFLQMCSGWILMPPNQRIFTANLQCKVLKHNDETQKAGEYLNSRASLKQRYTIESKQSHKNKLCWRATELSLRLGAQSEDTELIMGALSWAWWPPQLYSLLLSGNSAPTDVFTQPLLPVINELSAWVCVETIVGLPQRHMCRGCDWGVVFKSADLICKSEKITNDAFEQNTTLWATTLSAL